MLQLLQETNITAMENKVMILEDLAAAADRSVGLHSSNIEYFTTAAGALHKKATSAKNKQEKNKLNADAANAAAKAEDYTKLAEDAKVAAAAAKEEAEKTKELIAQLKVTQQLVSCRYEACACCHQS